MTWYFSAYYYSLDLSMLVKSMTLMYRIAGEIQNKIPDTIKDR